MISLFKKTVLTIAALGCVGSNVTCSEKKSASNASKGAVAFATGVMMTGGAGMMAGLTGIMAQADTRGARYVTSPSVINKLTSIDPMVLLAVSGLAAGVAALYCCKEAKGFLAKLRSFLGSTFTVAGAMLLTGGYITYLGAASKNNPTLSDAGSYMWHGVQKPSQAWINEALFNSAVVTAGGALVALTGYAIQPVDKSEKQA